MPGRANVAGVAVVRSGSDETKPDLSGYPSRLMRGTSLLTRMCAHVAHTALAGSGADPSTIPAVFASGHGELNIAIEQLAMMVTGDGKISPARFKNSVHNTSAGIFSIAHENKGMSTSLAAGPLTVAYALLEAFGILEDGATEVLVVVGDEAVPQPLSQFEQWDSFAAAWVFGRRLDAGSPRVQLSELEARPGTPAPVPDGLADHPCRPAYALLQAIASETSGRVHLGREEDEAWSVMVGSSPTEPA
ncbi:MAG: beta-ketoacyl synthase chain length factor [Nannocystaceae bacterium]|nr:beta-ketoacyl synthase chain length factor [Nannocystaceae bacterium]